MSITKRIKELRKMLKLTQTEFANAMGFTMQGIQKWEANTVDIRDSSLALICSTFNVNKSWLINGEGEIFVEDKNDKSISKHTSIIRYYDNVNASAGYGAFNESEEYSDYPLPYGIDVDIKNDVVINIYGDSMSPTLQNKDKVLLSTAPITQLNIEKIYALLTGDTLIVKRFAGVHNDSYVFSSDNKIYSNIYLEKSDGKNKVVGIVKGILYRKLDSYPEK